MKKQSGSSRLAGYYGNRSFQGRGTKLERFLHKNQHAQRKLLNFEFWILDHGELSKIGHHFKGGFFSKSAIRFLDLQISKKKYSKKLS